MIERGRMIMKIDFFLERYLAFIFFYFTFASKLIEIAWEK